MSAPEQTLDFGSFGGGFAYDSIETVRLARREGPDGGEYVLHVLSRTGEPLSGIEVSVSLQHRMLTCVLCVFLRECSFAKAHMVAGVGTINVHFACVGPHRVDFRCRRVIFYRQSDSTRK